MKTNSKKIKHTVVLVNYKQAKDTIACINSIRKAKDAPHIIVVDNGSDINVVSELAAAYPGLDLIHLDDNLGFGYANNIGIQKALKLGSQVVYVLNNDTEVDSNLFFRSYRYVLGKNRIAGGKIYYAKGYEYHEGQRGRGDIIWYAGGYMDWGNVVSTHLGVDQLDHGQYDKTTSTDFITGCFMAIPRQVFKKLGYFDEKLFLYLEDTDLSFRARKLAIELMYNPKLVLYHRNSSSSSAGSALVDYYLNRNRFVIAKRYGTLRLSFALVKEAIFRNWQSPIRRQAFIDYLFGNMGNRNAIINNIVNKYKL